MPYCGLPVFGSVLYAVQRRYVGAINGHEQLSADLAARLVKREAELSRNHQHLRELEHAQTLADERERLMRDMYDGLGSALTSSVVLVERGEVQPKALPGRLRECADDLRAVIDSLEPIDNDLVALVAMPRFRIGQRLDAAGVRLDWEMQDLLPLDWMGPTEALQVMRARRRWPTSSSTPTPAACGLRQFMRVNRSRCVPATTMRVSTWRLPHRVGARRPKGRMDARCRLEAAPEAAWRLALR